MNISSIKDVNCDDANTNLGLSKDALLDSDLQVPLFLGQRRASPRWLIIFKGREKMNFCSYNKGSFKSKRMGTTALNDQRNERELRSVIIQSICLSHTNTAS